MTKWTEHDFFRLAEWGYGCYQQGDLRRARILFAAILEARPADSYAARGLAGVALQEGNAEEAVQLMVQVLQARLRLAEALIAAGRLAEARQGIATLRGDAMSQDLLRLELRLHALSAPHATIPGRPPITGA
jgi:thioredoxin-like negative regulator of GroEL